MKAKHIEGRVELSVPISKSRIMWLIPSTCCTQNLVCSDSSQNIPLVIAWGSRNVDDYIEIKGSSFYMFSIHMCDLCRSASRSDQNFWQFFVDSRTERNQARRNKMKQSSRQQQMCSRFDGKHVYIKRHNNNKCAVFHIWVYGLTLKWICKK